VNEIIDALNLAPIYKNIQLWRGNIFKNELNIGDKFSFENLDEKNRYALKFSDYGFMSKSSDIEIGLEFSGNHCCLLLFTYDNPQHFLNISSISRYMDEKEYITFPGEEYIINNKYLTIYNNEIITFYHCKKISNVYDKGFFPKINNEISNILNKFHNNMFNIMNLLNDKKYLIMTNNNIKLICNNSYCIIPDDKDYRKINLNMDYIFSIIHLLIAYNTNCIIKIIDLSPIDNKMLQIGGKIVNEKIAYIYYRDYNKDFNMWDNIALNILNNIMLFFDNNLYFKYIGENDKHMFEQQLLYLMM